MQSIFLAALIVATGCSPESVQIGGSTFDVACIDVARGESSLAFADLDGDGDLDLAVASQSGNNVVVFRGHGDGSFARVATYAAGEDPTHLIAADMNGDGEIDLALANHETHYLTFLIGDGRGGFTPAKNSPFRIDVDPHPHAVALADMDRDGFMDLIVDDRSGLALRVFRGTGGGGFESEGIRIDVGADPYRGFAIGDMNRDGVPDVVTPNPESVGILLGLDSPGINFQRVAPLPGSSPFAVHLGDMNGDGYLDVIAASESGSAPVSVFVGDGEGQFRQAAGSPFRMSAGAKDIAVGDINGDGIEDALVTNWSSDAAILLGGTSEISSMNLTGLKNPWGVAVADVNRDGRDDFAIADGVSSEVRIYVSRVPSPELPRSQ